MQLAGHAWSDVNEGAFADVDRESIVIGCTSSGGWVSGMDHRVWVEPSKLAEDGRPVASAGPFTSMTGIWLECGKAGRSTGGTEDGLEVDVLPFLCNSHAVDSLPSMGISQEQLTGLLASEGEQVYSRSFWHSTRAVNHQLH
jgi:hypothetical protein